MSAVEWTFLSVNGAVIDVAVEDAEVVSDKNVKGTGDVIGTRSPPAATTELPALFSALC